MIVCSKNLKLDCERKTGRISVVIPTRGRPILLDRAVQSALNQDFRDLEVIVVIDGVDPETEAVLTGFTDPRLHVLSLPNPVGGADARNIGVRYARGKWIALLDDDDEWLPNKLALQYNAAESVPGPYVFVASRFIERTEHTERELPRRLPGLHEPFSEYMFARRGWQSGEGFVQTSTWFVSRQLLTDIPFTSGLKRCQDLDWLLHATAQPETRVMVVPETLAIFHHDERAERVSRTSDWRFLFDWIVTNKRYLTPRAFSFFIATFCVPSASRQRAGMRIFFSLLRECMLRGSPDCKCLTLFFCWYMPEGHRRSLRGLLTSDRRAVAPRSLPSIHGPLAGKAN
jgi:glycosyltransferase involved in cell wall biosynthesis